MDEITKRFEIIRLAIQLGDYDTILVQCQQLPKISMDAHLGDIIALLKSRNYRQALYEMRYYAQNLEKSFFTISNQPEEQYIPQEEPMTTQKPQERVVEQERVIGLDEMLQMADDTKRRVKEYQATPEFPAEKILEQFKRELERAREKRITTESEMVERGVYKKEIEMAEDEVSLPLSEPESMKSLSKDEIELMGDISIEIEEDNINEPVNLKTPQNRKDSTNNKRDNNKRERVKKESPTSDSLNNIGTKTYLPISYIDQKFNNMIYQYPPLEDTGDIPEVVKEIKDRLSIREYSDEDIEEFLDYYFRYKKENQIEAAAKVLLLGASTESKFAKFLLGRELFKGEVLEKNDTEAFNLINSLADQNYPEAICDLGQFYEYGIAIAKDKHMAKLLYEEAAELGVERAKRHYERLKGSKGVIGILKKLNIAKKIVKGDDD